MKLFPGLPLAALAVATLLPDLAVAQPNRTCGEREKIIERLGERYGEARTGRGLSHNNGMVEVFASEETGTFTILITLPTGQTCLIAAGDFWEQVPDKVARSGQKI